MLLEIALNGDAIYLSSTLNGVSGVFLTKAFKSGI